MGGEAGLKRHASTHTHSHLKTFQWSGEGKACKARANHCHMPCTFLCPHARLLLRYCLCPHACLFLRYCLCPHARLLLRYCLCPALCRPSSKSAATWQPSGSVNRPTTTCCGKWSAGGSEGWGRAQVCGDTPACTYAWAEGCLLTTVKQRHQSAREKWYELLVVFHPSPYPSLAMLGSIGRECLHPPCTHPASAPHAPTLPALPTHPPCFPLMFSQAG